MDKQKALIDKCNWWFRSTSHLPLRNFWEGIWLICLWIKIKGNKPLKFWIWGCYFSACTPCVHTSQWKSWGKVNSQCNKFQMYYVTSSQFFHRWDISRTHFPLQVWITRKDDFPQWSQSSWIIYCSPIISHMYCLINNNITASLVSLLTGSVCSATDCRD